MTAPEAGDGHPAGLAAAAHADPALDALWPHHGPCLICGVPGLGTRHRRIDAIAGQLAAGDSAEDVAADMGVSLEAVEVVRDWSARWPGAW